MTLRVTELRVNSMAYRDSGRCVSLLATVFLLSASTPASHPVLRPDRGCVYGDWTVLAKKMPNPLNAIAFTSVGVGREATFVLQEPLGYRSIAPSPNIKKQAQRRFFISTLSGHQLSVPTRSAFLFPRAAVDHNGDLNLVWGEPDSAVSVEQYEFAEEIPVSSIWYAKLKRNAPFHPVRIYYRKGIIWNFRQSSELVSDAAGGLHVAFPLSLSEGGNVAALSYTNNGWVANTASSPAAPSYVTLGAKGKDLVVAYVAAGSGIDRENGLYSVRSHDGGKSWSAPHSLGGNGEVPAYEPKILTGGDSLLHLFWTQHSPHSTATIGFWHASSRDGLQWSSQRLLPIEVQVSRAMAVADRCGTLHVVAQVITQDGSKLGYTRFANGAWTPFVTLFPVYVGELPTLFLGQDGNVYVFYYESHLRPTAPDMYRARLAELPIAFRNR